MRYLELKVVVESDFKDDVVRKLALDEVRHIFPEAVITQVQETKKPAFVPNGKRDSW